MYSLMWVLLFREKSLLLLWSTTARNDQDASDELRGFAAVAMWPAEGLEGLQIRYYCLLKKVQPLCLQL